MNKMILTIAALFGTFVAGSAAHAAQFSVFVTQAHQVNPNQVQLRSMVQKTILLDTTRGQVRLMLSPICGADLPCPEMIKFVTFTLKNFDQEGSRVVHAKAQGVLEIRGVRTPTTLEITQTPDNSTTIQVTSTLSKDLGAQAVSTFVGSPAETNSFFQL